ncbi:MAG TPA: LCP family protein [Patescibacteria group bacterium]|nr:LCP family protein [Patescibacteria group bacterium]
MYRTQINFLQPDQLNNGGDEEPPKKKKPFFSFFVVLLLIIALVYTYRSFSSARQPEDGAAYDPITLQPKKMSLLQTVKNFIFHSDNILEGQKEDRINILLLGMGGPGHDGPYLTDTNIILSIKPRDKTVAMISVPRDLGVKINQYGWRKINHANAFGEIEQAGQGGEYARKIFSETFGLDVPYYIRVDFKAFTELIDEVGGVEVNVERSFSDSQFPGPNHSYQTVSFQAGVQTMNGTQALQYARSRHGTNGEGSDFARAKRQQQIIMALKERLLSFGTYTNPMKVQKMLGSLSSHITTNLNFGQIMYLASLARETNGVSKTLVLDNGSSNLLVNGYSPSGAYILSPRTGNFNEINEAIENIFNENYTIATTRTPVPDANKSVFPTAKLEIQNGTWKVGLASKFQKKLEDKGFTVVTIGNSVYRPVDSTQIYLLRKNIATDVIKSLEKETGFKSTTSIPEWLSEEYDNPDTPESEVGLKYSLDTDILVIAGNDLNI